jgi:hypothetical protein
MPYLNLLPQPGLRSGYDFKICIRRSTPTVALPWEVREYSGTHSLLILRMNVDLFGCIRAACILCGTNAAGTPGGRAFEQYDSWQAKVATGGRGLRLSAACDDLNADASSP